ncbi:MAG TPA: CAP domain-containing protein [Polyangia bacterium]|nr:CAP domain-containing protein [Polyangia bacterium]
MTRAVRCLSALAAVVGMLPVATGCGSAGGVGSGHGTGPTTTAVVPAVSVDDAKAGAFPLPDSGAPEYSSRPAPPAPLDGTAARIRAAIPAGLIADGRLDAAAEVIARAEESGIRVTAEFSRDLLWWRGVPEAQSALGLFSGADDASLVERVARWAAEEAEDGARWHGLALRKITGGARVVAIVLRPGAELEPVPRRLAGPGKLALAGRAPTDVGAITLVASAPDDTAVEQPAQRDGTRFTVSALLHAPGIWQVELMGEGAQGPAVLANFPVYVGVAVPAAVGVTATELESRDPRELERLLFEMLGETRRERGLSPLQRSAALDGVARRYSAELAETGAIAHVSPRSGGPADRAAAAGLHFPKLRENLARAHSAAEAHAGLMGSPSHRNNMLDPLAREAGIGAHLVDGDGGTYLVLTQLIASRPKTIDPGETGNAIVEETNRRRRLAGVPPATRSPGLDRAARALLASCFGGKKPKSVDFGDEGLARVIAVEVTAAGLDGVLGEAPPALLDPATTHLGVAVTQGTDPRHGEGMICLRLLLGQRR